MFINPITPNVYVNYVEYSSASYRHNILMLMEIMGVHKERTFSVVTENKLVWNKGRILNTAKYCKLQN